MLSTERILWRTRSFWFGRSVPTLPSWRSSWALCRAFLDQSPARPVLRSASFVPGFSDVEQGAPARFNPAGFSCERAGPPPPGSSSGQSSTASFPFGAAAGLSPTVILIEIACVVPSAVLTSKTTSSEPVYLGLD